MAGLFDRERKERKAEGKEARFLLRDKRGGGRQAGRKAAASPPPPLFVIRMGLRGVNVEPVMRSGFGLFAGLRNHG